MKDVRITFTTDEIMAEKLKSTAAKNDVSVSKIIREAVKLYFQEESK
jgi:metal-responsive CopG/Arc/MetJ family transcriptional regulator